MTTTSPPTLAEIRRHRGRLRSQGWQDEQTQEYVRAADHDECVAVLYSQIDGLMKRLLRTEATLRILSDTSHFKDMDAMAEFARIALASQGGGDG